MFIKNYANKLAISNFTPGPMVEAIAAFRMNVPLAPLGLAACTALAKALIFSASWFSVKLALPIPAWTMPFFSALN